MESPSPASPSLPSPPQATPGRWRRRHSQPNPTLDLDSAGASYLPLPLSFPTVSGLRGALLSYVGEAENALRERLGLVENSPSVSSSPGPSSEDDTDLEHPDYFELASPGEGGPSTATSSALAAGQNAHLRRRVRGQSQPITGVSARNGHAGGQSAASIVEEDYARALASLSKLREDVLAYVPASLPGAGMAGGAREWLRGLPTRLHAVDLGLGDEWPDPLSASSRAVRTARHRVLDALRANLPPDDWAGWETLGWEEHPDEPTPRAHHIKSCSLDEKYARDDDVDNVDEPEYLFPNRTPGPAEAIARHRIRRSKSLGADDFCEVPSFLDAWMRPSEIAAVVDDEGEADDIVVEETLLEPVADLDIDDIQSKCDVHGSHPSLPGPTVPEALVRSCDGANLITFNDLPFWWRNNQYIHTSYRFIPLGRAGPIPLIKSAFSLHNETVNIHSHFVPTLFIMGFIPLIVWSSPLPDAHWIDTAMLISYLLAAASCLFSSAAWHVLSGCASLRWFEWGACVDYIGISWLIALSFNTVVYNAYYCQPRTVLLYASINVAFGALGSYLPFQKWFNQRKNKPWRILFFLSLNVAMIAPVVQLFYQQGYDRAKAFVAPFGMSVVSYLTGLVFYAFHWPECTMPGRFDRWGASHQMWHFGIVIAIYLHYNAIFTAYDARWAYSCAAPGASVSVPQAVSDFIWGTTA